MARYEVALEDHAARVFTEEVTSHPVRDLRV